MFLRRCFPLLLTACGLLAAGILQSAGAADDAVGKKVAQAHEQIWSRFIDAHGFMLDFTDFEGHYDRPTPEECRAGKPNALAWWTPTENAAMFNGSYMEALCLRWQRTQAEADRAKANRLMRGLLKLSTVSGTPGFIARGVSTDGKTPYPMGSNDQTSPWFYGLWRYLDSGMATPAEKEEIVGKMVEVATVLEASGWQMPCHPPAPAPFRGTYTPFTWEGAPRLLFACKVLHTLTGDEVWDRKYKEAAQERGGMPERSRLEICAEGMVFDNPKHRHSWTGASSGSVLRGLWELETDPVMKAEYAKGLEATARLAAEGLALHQKYAVNAPAQKFQMDWRVLNEWWRPQTSEAEAVEVAMIQVRQLGKLSPQRYQEFTFVREPAFAAWLVTLSPDSTWVEEQRESVRAVLGYYRYDQLYYSQFYPVEMAWERLELAGKVGKAAKTPASAAD
jgi:hypothetical protein